MSLLSAVDALLVAGGDERIALDAYGVNRYGYAPAPQPMEASFGSSTASTISVGAREAVAGLFGRLGKALRHRAPEELYEQEMARVKSRFLALCGLADYAGLEMVFAASGTDIHLYAAELTGGASNAALLSITVEASETGSGVATALKGCHFMSRTACGEAVTPGRALAANGRSLQLAVSARDREGRSRPEDEVEAEIDGHIRRAVAKGQPVLLVVADVSKTGLISPGLAGVMRLQARWGSRLGVMIDACQFRLSRSTLRAYLDLGFPVAVTGSKFLGGPAFSGALLCPPAIAGMWAESRLTPGLGAYAAQGEWPRAFAARRHFRNTCNFGLLLRWEAALHELAAFQAVPEGKLYEVTAAFSKAILARLQNGAGLEPADHRPLDRKALYAGQKAGSPEKWDEIPTIFPFRLISNDGGYLAAPATEAIYHQLARGEGAPYPMRVGQPVFCGFHQGQQGSVLRLCFSARLAVEAAQSPEALQLVIARGLNVLDHAAGMAAGYLQQRAV